MDNVRIAERLRPSNEQLAAQKGSKRLEMLIESCLRHCKFQAVLVINLTGYVQELALAVLWQKLGKCKQQVTNLKVLTFDHYTFDDLCSLAKFMSR